MDSSLSESSPSAALRLGPDGAPSEAVLRAQLEKILCSGLFREAEGLKRFLRYSVEQTLHGQGDQLKEYRLAIDVFDRSASFDPRLDPVVRMAARRLRSKLREYYEQEGRSDPIRIEVPKGAYTAVFSENPGVVGAPARASSSESPLPVRHRFWVQTMVAGTIVAAVGVLVWLGAVFISRMHSKSILANTDYVLISDFANSTGDSVFDDTLKQAVSVQLQQSPFLNILSDAKVLDTLHLMTKPLDTKLTAGLAREVCQRAGGKVYIAGSIAHLGSQFVIDLAAVNCQTGDVFAHQQVTAEKEHVLKALDEAARQLRKRLGESLGSLQKFDAPLEDATTSSLEALKAYSVGMVKDRENDAAAVPFLKHAIESDPNFASAYEALGACYFNLGESGVARENFTKAFELRDRVSERERFTIAARYYNYVVGDLEKAIENYQLWQQAYPRDVAAHANLGGLYGATGQYEKAIAETLEAIRLNSDSGSGSHYSNLVLSYAALNRLDDAKRAYRQEIARGIDDPIAKVNWFGVAFVEGNTAEMDRLMAWAAGKPEGEDIFLAAKSDTEAFAGHVTPAREFSRQAVQSALRNFQKETAAQYQMDEALWEAEFGNRQLAQEHTAAALRFTTNHDTQILAALAMARTGNSAEADRMANDLAKRYPQDTLVNGYWIPMIRGAIEIARDAPARAVTTLEAAAPYELSSPQAWSGLGGPLYPAYLRGLAYLQLRQGNAAETEFQKLIDHRGFMLACPLSALAHLGVARASALEGDTSKARTAYQDFFGIWKSADSDVPILKQAKAEYAKLE
jgi:tetratricopeptide (TPR) repeat protein